MDLLPLPAIGWIAVLLSGTAIGIGAWLIVGMHLQGDEMRQHLAARTFDDMLLFGIWVLGLAGGVGLLLGKPWSRVVLELFCWALVMLVMMSSYSRLRVAQPPRTQVFMGHLLFIIPIFAFCAATILTLRSEATLKALSSQAGV
jgi:hypothetical protein